ncbi:MAG: hypothetical protein HGA82_03705 [Anaerolineales bacterium]|nr:hypothetical protein [Anaerolineales bacterium]
MPPSAQDLPLGHSASAETPIRSSVELGAVIREQRKRLALKQLDLAGLGNTGNRFIVDLENGKPTRKFGTLGLFKANMTPDVVPVIIGKSSKDGLACGAKGVGEICSIPTAPAVQLAYFNRDGIFRTKLPLENTPYSKK